MRNCPKCAHWIYDRKLPELLCGKYNMRLTTALAQCRRDRQKKINARNRAKYKKIELSRELFPYGKVPGYLRGWGALTS